MSAMHEDSSHDLREVAKILNDVLGVGPVISSNLVKNIKIVS